MVFDKNKDKQLWKKDIEFEKGKIEVSVMQYDEGAKKLQLSRIFDEKWAKLGRLTKEELDAVIPALVEAMGVM